MNDLKTLLSLLFTSLLMACGSGSSSNPGEEQASQSITGINGKFIAVDTMELLGVMLVYEGYLNQEINTPATEICGKGGVKTVVDVTDIDGIFGNDGDRVGINYNECKDSIGDLNFTINGQHLVVFESDKITFSSSSLAINDRQGNWTLKDVSLVVDRATNALTVKMNVDGGPSGLKAVADSGGQPFVGPILCPESGKLTLSASDGSFVTINGASGGKLSLGINGNDQALVCTEIEVNKEPPPDGELTPPGGPS